jgi:hypothetical protein
MAYQHQNVVRPFHDSNTSPLLSSRIHHPSVNEQQQTVEFHPDAHGLDDNTIPISMC